VQLDLEAARRDEPVGRRGKQKRVVEA
jgi:hypothetical protein